MLLAVKFSYRESETQNIRVTFQKELKYYQIITSLLFTNNWWSLNQIENLEKAYIFQILTLAFLTIEHSPSM